MSDKVVSIDVCPTCLKYRPMYEDGRCNACIVLEIHTPLYLRDIPVLAQPQPTRLLHRVQTTNKTPQQHRPRLLERLGAPKTGGQE